MVIKVKAKYNGEVALSLNKAIECQKKGEHLIIKYMDNKMIIRNKDISSSMRIGTQIYFDRKTQQPYQFAYFKWTPIKNQLKFE